MTDALEKCPKCDEPPKFYMKRGLEGYRCELCGLDTGLCMIGEDPRETWKQLVAETKDGR